MAEKAEKRRVMLEEDLKLEDDEDAETQIKLEFPLHMRKAASSTILIKEERE